MTSVRAVPLQYFPGSHDLQEAVSEVPLLSGLYVPRGQGTMTEVPSGQ